MTSERNYVRVVSLERFLWLIEALARSPLRSDLHSLLASRSGRVFSMRELIGFLYPMAGGGPLNAENCIGWAIKSLRSRGVPIRMHGYRGYSYERHDARLP